jgi:hypothetical protein
MIDLLQAVPGLQTGMTVEGVLVWALGFALTIAGLIIKVLWSDNKELREKQEARADQVASALTTLSGALAAKGGSQ